MVSANALPQTPCPHCQAPVAVFAPGCFNCRKSIQWPPPANEQQAAIAQAATAQFNQMLAYYQQQAAQQQAQQPAPQYAQQQQPPQQQNSVGGDLDGLLEVTRHQAVNYDPQAAEDMEGLMPQSYAEFVPAQLPVEPMPEFTPTQATTEGPGLGITPMQGGEFESTQFSVAAEVPSAPVQDFDDAKFTALTQTAPANVVPDVELERTAIANENSPTRRKADVEETRLKRICKDCGTVTDRSTCPSCGAPTKERAA